MDGYRFPCDPTANPDTIVSGAQYRFTVLDEKVLRYEWAEDGQFEDRASTFAIWRNFPKPIFRVEESGNQMQIITPLMHLTYDKQEFTPNGFVVQFAAKLTSYGAEWRYGHHPQRNLGGTARTLDQVDGRCDMGLGILSRAGYSILDDSASMLFGKDGFVAPRRPGRRVDGYIFAYGTDYKGAMQTFYAISGHQPTVPRWCLGNWWSRYHAYSDSEYLSLMDKFKQNNIPLSVAVIDVDWHWRKESFVPHTGWTGYTWNTNLFRNPEAFVRGLRDRGLRVTLNDHPHAGVHSHEEVYEELAKSLAHDTTHRDPIQFDPTSPDFMYAYFNVIHRKLERQGCDFWWIDWQQGLQSRIPGVDPLWLLNHFQYLDTQRAVPSSLPIIFSRYAGPGSHRYPVGFSGDTVVTWESLKFQPEFTATASNIGFGWWSHDIGGHLSGDRDDERTTRWVQFAVFSPALRLHSTHGRWMSKEPWLYRQENMLAMRDALQFRHRLVPYIYSVAATSQSTLPLVQPLYWSFPTRDSSYQFPNEYFFGPSLVVSPIVERKDSRTNLAWSKVWIPPQRHVDIFTGVVYDGDRELDMYRSIDSIPVLAPEGTIIPLDREAIPANGCKNPLSLEVIVVVGRNGSFTIIEDAQDDHDWESAKSDRRRSLEFSYSQSAGRLSFDSGSKAWDIRFLALRIDEQFVKVLADDHEVPATCCVDGNDTVVRIEPLQAFTKITIDIGLDPQLDVNGHHETISRLLHDFQIMFSLKDKIWAIVQANQPRTVKIGRLLALGTEEVVRGPILELLLADGRA